MTLPVSPNPISLTQIRDEFNQTGTANLLNYYAGGGIVPSGTVGYPGGVMTPIPTSGVISLQNFYGATAVSIIQITSSLTWTVPPGVTSVSLLVVGGGGGAGNGGPADGGGGGGAGGASFVTGYPVSGTLDIIIGAGGSGGSGVNGTAGSPSRAGPIIGGIIVPGGGYGGGVNGDRNGGNGASGGGACGYTGAHPGGSGTSPYGFGGGSAGRYNNGGGGGGFSTNGQDTGDQEGFEIDNGKGGAGLEIILPPNSTIYPFNGSFGTPFTASKISVSGGGGGGQGGTPWIGYPGAAGGAAGGISTTIGNSAAAYTGGGGGGGGGSSFGYAGGSGGSGVVYIIYSTVSIPNGVVEMYDSAISVKDGTQTDTVVNTGLTLNSDGTTTAINTPTGAGVTIRNSIGPKWYSSVTPGIGSSYYAYAVYAGTSPTATPVGTFNSWVSLGSGQSWYVSNTPTTPGSGITYGVTAQISIAISNTPGGPTLAYCTLELSSVSSDSAPPPDPGGGGGGA